MSQHQLALRPGVCLVSWLLVGRPIGLFYCPDSCANMNMPPARNGHAVGTAPMEGISVGTPGIQPNSMSVIGQQPSPISPSLFRNFTALEYRGEIDAAALHADTTVDFGVSPASNQLLDRALPGLAAYHMHAPPSPWPLLSPLSLMDSGTGTYSQSFSVAFSH
jgi:hypothetical protein